MSKSINTETRRPTNLIQAIERAAALLDALSQQGQGVSLGTLSAKVGLSKGTAHRILNSLMYFDFVRQDTASRDYSLGFKLVELGSSLLDQIDLRKEAAPFLQNLSQRTNETTYLVVLNRAEVVYLEKIEAADSSTVLRATAKVGQRNAANSCAVGKTLLADLPEEELGILIQEMPFVQKTENTITDPLQLREHLKVVLGRGYAVDDEESERGIRCVAAPIRDERGRAVAAISISGPAIRVTRQRIQALLIEEVTRTALEISRKMGFRGEAL
ncbi:MAG: IclR family transcriptional regulator [Syntrophobacteraceae bacterium]